MRLPLKGNDYLCGRVNPLMEKIEKGYLDAIEPSVSMKLAPAMLGDGTVTQANTFDPSEVRRFYAGLAKKMGDQGWSFSDISSSETEDLHRLFFQVSKDIGKYHFSGYFGIQYHALPYYRVDKRVIEIQKELSRIADEAGSVFVAMSSAADKALQQELKERGYADMGFEELFAKMFDDEKLAGELESKATTVEQTFPEFEKIRKRKTELFAELNDLLITLYQTSAVSIDHNRQMQGEEGVTTYFDLEVVRNKKTGKREAYIDAAGVSAEWADRLAGELDAVTALLKRQ
ncbi:MAG TPA: hypothetical protein VJP79_10015 [Nitrososphaera sp.]|nr:hypothetical protein [Nitrososphaera sp.]